MQFLPVLKNNQKYFRLITSFLLACYIWITVANVLHYHSININNVSVPFIVKHSDNNKHASQFFDGLFCPIHFAYNSLKNSESALEIFSLIVFQKNQILDKNPDTIYAEKQIFYHYSLRAPPSFFS